MLLGWFLTTMLFGAIAALLPADVVARLIMVIFAGFLFILAWGLRKATTLYPERALIYVSIFILTTSIVWPQYVFFSVGGLPRINPFSLSAVIGLILILVMLVYYKSFSSRISALLAEIKAVVILFILWISWRVISNLLSDEPLVNNLELLREIIYVYSLFGYALFICQGKNGMQLLGRVIVASTVIVGLAGLIEALQGKNIFITFAGSEGTGEVGDAIATIVADKVRAGAERVQSVFAHPILFGQYLGSVAPVVLLAAVLDHSRLWKLMAYIAMPLIVIGVLETGSRAALMALMVSGIVMGGMLWLHLITTSKKYRGMAIMAVPIILIAIFAAYGFSTQLLAGNTHTESGSTMVRATQLHYALEAIPKSPIFGYGLGSAVHIAGIKTSLNTMTMDIFYVSVLLDSGWVGLTLFIAMVLSLIILTLRYVIRSNGQNIYYVSAYFAAGLAVLVSLGAVSMQQNIMLFMMSASVLAIAKYESNKYEF